MTKNTNSKILLVEDEPDVCSSIQSYLGKRGFRVSMTASGTEALSLIPVIKPDMMILDFTLDDLDGKEVLKRLRKKDKTTKVIVLTGQMLEPKDKKKIIALGVCDYLNKPVSLWNLENIINKALGRSVTVKKKTQKFVKDDQNKKSTPSQTHQLMNLLGIIRNRCENYTLNIQDGIYSGKTKSELTQMSLEIMQDCIDAVDKAARIIDPHE